MTWVFLRAIWISLVAAGVAVAAPPLGDFFRALSPGDSETLTCPTYLHIPVATTTADGRIVGATVACGQVSPTPTATPTPMGTAQPGLWHVATNHEHGHAPPSWVETSGLPPSFQGMENHRGFKGFLTRTAEGIDAYVIMHLFDFPPALRVQYHSVRTYWRDPSDGVSYFQGFADTGAYPARRFTRLQEGDGLPARTINLQDAASFAQFGHGCQTWYVNLGKGVGAWLICSPPYEYDTTDDMLDARTWAILPGHQYGLVRGMDLNMAVHLGDPVGAYCTNGYGPEVIACSAPGAYQQFLAPTLTNHMAFADGAWSLFHRVDPIEFPGRGLVVLPN